MASATDERINKILDRLRTTLGPLEPHIRERIRNSILVPSEYTWDMVYSIVIEPKAIGGTLWGAWIEIDPNAIRIRPQGHWPAYPSPFVILRALEIVADRIEKEDAA